MAKIIKLPRCNPAENEAIQYRPGEILDIINWFRTRFDDITELEICMLENNKISLNINGEHSTIYAFDYIAYDCEWHKPYIGKMSKFTLEERYGIKC